MRLATPEGIQLKIDPPSHRWRNVSWLAAAVAATALIAGYYTVMGRWDARQLNQLESFRSQYAQRCDVAEFAEPAPQVLRDAYVRSSSLRVAVDVARLQLEAGASCDDVVKRLRAADFPLPPAKPPILVHPQQ